MATTDEPEPSYTFEGTAEFNFDLAGPLFVQMRDLLEKVKPMPLALTYTNSLPEKPGVYVLRHEGIAVYVGKADDSVRIRLSRHAETLRGRQKLVIEDMTFSCITFAPTWNPFLPESHLIEHYQTAGSRGWNGKGFGSNEPGVVRGGTHLKDDNFYKRFPLRDDWICEGVPPGEHSSTLELLRTIKREVPFYFKFQGNRVEGNSAKRRMAEEARRDYDSTRILVPRTGMTARELLILIAKSLPGQWQATITPSHMLLYKEHGAEYPEMKVVWPPAP
jgi:hypothetical protein